MITQTETFCLLTTERLFYTLAQIIGEVRDMGQDELVKFVGSPLVNLAMTMGGRIVSVQLGLEVSEGSVLLTTGDDAKIRLRTYSSSVAI